MSLASVDDLTCSICHNVFDGPVVLSCIHSFCEVCLYAWWTRTGTCICPVCKAVPATKNPPRNLALKNLCEAFLRTGDGRGATRRDAVCAEHGERLKLFCLDHQQPACLVCRDSRKHAGHKFTPVNEAATDKKEQLWKSLTLLREKLQLFEQVKGSSKQTAVHIHLQAQHTEMHIKRQFEKLHQFLQEEEEARVTALREEEEQKIQMMKEKIEDLNKEISTLSGSIRALEEKLRADDILFLENYRFIDKRVQRLSLTEDPQLVSGALIDVAKHLGNLSFNIWNNMKETVSYYPVVLDPNSADPELIMSEHLTSVRSVERRKQLPTNPERSKFLCSVLGAEGFSSGAHGWDVEVGQNEDWEVGVLGEYAQMNGRIQSGLWRIMFSDSEVTAFSSTDGEKVVEVEEQLRRIRVQLDFDEGKLSFWNRDKNTHIHTFKHAFTDTLFPYVYTESHVPIKILPVNISVMVEKLMIY